MKKLSVAAMACIMAASMSVTALASDSNASAETVAATEVKTDENAEETVTETEEVTAEAEEKIEETAVEDEESVAETEEKADEAIKVVVNGNEIVFADQAPIIKNDRTLVPLRGVLETMGIEIEWNAEEQSVNAVRGETYALFKIGDTTLKTAAGEITLDVAPEIISDRTMIPLRAVTEAFGAKVEWDADTKTVTITDETDKVLVDTAKLENEVKAEDGTVLYTVSVEYPVLNDNCEAAGKAAINEAIRKSIDESVASGSEDLKKSSDELYKASVESKEEYKPLSLTGSYQLTLMNEKMVSFYIDLSYDFHGAHPMTYRNGYTYDLAGGKELTLADVTGVSDDKAMEVIKNAYADAIKADTEKMFFEDALENLDESLKTVDFYMEDGIVVCFTELYSVAPYAAGFVNVPVSTEKFA